MKRSGFFFALFLVSAAFTACSKLLQVTLFNNTGETIALHAEFETETIAPSRFSHFKYPGQGANRVFRLSSNSCVYLYEFPSEIVDYPIEMRFERGIQVQVEKDFGIDLLPVSYEGDAPASRDTILRQEGFPLQPVSRKCH
ncbi:MAG TPA: hypothetical protein VJP60_01985 [Rhizomicrobium sp.]|nr:hypothetical protein [Rhizomicrobium sp.]